MTTAEQRLLALIDQRRAALLDDLRLHVGLPTGAFHAPGLDDTRARLTARLEKIGGRTQLIPGDPRPDWLYGAERPGGPIPPTAVVRRPSNDPKACRILISGHLDTVHDPRGPFRSLTLAPDGKTATGPGCVDMKGGLVIALAALEALSEAGVDVNWTVVLNSDEETGSYHSERAIRAAATGADLGLVLEPALPDGSLVVERPGSGQFAVRVRGKAAHVGRDFTTGVSAVTALAPRLLTLAGLSDPGAGSIINVGPITGGHATNVVPDSACAWGNARFPTAEVGRALESRVKALATTADAMPRVEVLTSFNRPAKPLIPATRALAEFAARTAESIGQRLPFGKTGGVCDGNILQHAGMPTIDTLGVRGGGLHTPQEWIELASLVERCQLLALLVARLSTPKWREVLGLGA